MSSIVGSDEVLRQRYFLKLHNVYYQATPMFLRKVFCAMWKVINGSEWEEDKSNGKKLSTLKGLQTILKNGKLQKKNVESGNCRLWDLSLLTDIIIALKSENPNTIVPSFDMSAFTKKNLEWLKSTRNKLAHASTTEMDQVTFQPLWDESVKVLSRLGMQEHDMVLIETLPEESLYIKKPTENEIKAEELKNSGNELFRKRNLLKAVIHYTKAMQLNGISQELLGTLYYNRSAAHIEIGNVSSAKDDAKSAITLRPNWFKGYARLGRAYEKSKQFAKALFNYYLAVDLGDDSPTTLNCVENCKMMIHKLRRCEATDPEILRQKDLLNKFNTDMASSILGEEQCEKFMKGNPTYLCTLARRYYFGRDGYQQSYEKAVEYFAQAAQLGNAEGLYNLGRMTQEGQGLEKDVLKGHQYILEAANKPTAVEYLPGSGLKFSNIGVMESWHHLGMAYHFGIAVKQNNDKALEWYRKAMEFGSGMSANNTACIYDDLGQDHFSKAVEFWKLSTYLKIERAAENLANAYKRAGYSKLAQEWYHYAVSMGSIDIILQRDFLLCDSEMENSFDREEFKQKLQEDVEKSSILSPILLKITQYRTKYPLLRETSHNCEANLQAGMEMGDKSESIRVHRKSQLTARIIRSLENNPQEIFETTPANFLVSSSGVDLLEMKEIFLSEIKESKEDTVFTGRALKLTIIEDAVFVYLSFYLLVEDNKGNITRLFLYNYPQTKEAQEEIGYGCRFYLIYPHYRKMEDGGKGLRVDDPQLIFKQPHLRNKDRCRYCGKEDGLKFTCGKCGRVTYFSKECLKRDADERQHCLVCVKHY